MLDGDARGGRIAVGDHDARPAAVASVPAPQGGGEFGIKRLERGENLPSGGVTDDARIFRPNSPDSPKTAGGAPFCVVSLVYFRAQVVTRVPGEERETQS